MKPQKGEHVFDVEIYSHTFNYSMTVELLAKFTYLLPAVERKLGRRSANGTG